MTRTSIHKLLLLAAAASLLSSRIAAAAPDPSSQKLDDLLSRASEQTTALVNEFSNVQCLEHVEQEKFRDDGKVESKEESSFNYLILLANSGGDLTLQESRIAVHEPKASKKNTPMLLSNGFATLFLVFHPAYSASFHFTSAGQEVLNGRLLDKVAFEHVTGMRSPAALALRGREYPLELSGMAWIDDATGAITKIEATIGDTLQDVGLKSLESEIDFSPSAFHGNKQTYWLPAVASIDVQTPRQHWRNTHHFNDYKEFSVGTEENDKKVSNQ